MARSEPAPMAVDAADWTTVKSEYVEGILDDGGNLVWLSLDQLGERHGVSAWSVRDHSRQEDWVASRAMFQRRMEFERQEAKAKEAARLGADLDVSALRIARGGMAITSARIAELGAKAQRRSQELQQTPNAEPATKPVDSLELDRLQRTAAGWYELGTKALGDAQRVRLEVDVHAELEVTAEVRDQRSLGLLAILADIDKLDEGVEDVIDVSAGRLSVAAGADPSADGETPDAEGQPVHPSESARREPEPEADGVPATG
jgi:hypothetical protein